MNSNLYTYCLRLADNGLILSHRIAEYCSAGPQLEEDLAITNVGLDLLGQAESFLKYAAEIKGDGTTEDDLAFKRKEKDFYCVHLTELPNVDYAYIMARQFLMDTFNYLLYKELVNSNDETIAGISAKAIKEVTYHLSRSSDWIIRLGQGTEESHQRIQTAFDEIWMFTDELFESDEIELSLAEEGVGVDSSKLRVNWQKKINEVFALAGLSVPKIQKHSLQYGKFGLHTEYLGYLLAEMQHIPLLYPDAKW
ncbi:MAG: 1,2-phenylacetyl-CoA epoxidase subunit PaaC [Bacteroidota bacterium]|nr:1,2-phenylacetyl-CoA epoxidase subunit PaaC [Bacteroidota bacterium]MEC8968591.1 1,2-phenylacetyl-CoA epoxidase subunit PaaC [Bacteroidota bacterium]